MRKRLVKNIVVVGTLMALGAFSGLAALFLYLAPSGMLLESLETLFVNKYESGLARGKGVFEVVADRDASNARCLQVAPQSLEEAIRQAKLEHQGCQVAEKTPMTKTLRLACQGDRIAQMKDLVFAEDLESCQAYAKLEKTGRFPASFADATINQQRRYKTRKTEELQLSCSSLFALGDFQKAKERCLRALDRDPSHCPTKDQLARIYYSLNRYDAYTKARENLIAANCPGWK